MPERHFFRPVGLKKSRMHSRIVVLTNVVSRLSGQEVPADLGEVATRHRLGGSFKNCCGLRRTYRKYPKEWLFSKLEDLLPYVVGPSEVRLSHLPRDRRGGHPRRHHHAKSNSCEQKKMFQMDDSKI